MTIFVNESTKVIVQGMTGSEGTKHTKRMLKAGTKIVAGVTPGKGGQSVDMDGQIIPVFNSVKEAEEVLNYKGNLSLYCRTNQLTKKGIFSYTPLI